MEQLIRNITTSITDQLSENRAFYTPDDLREYDIPEFLVQRVEVEIYRNLNESIVPPHSEWADMATEEVEQAWEQFIDAIVAEVRMPASFASTVFETSIADVMEMILQPRKAIPEVLFGPKKKLSIEDIEKRLSFITVNTHLGQAIYKYMKRRGQAEVEIGTARRIVIKVDERITANYNSLNWAQLLQPLFILAGPKIDTELFRVFFRDRKMDRISRRFDLLSGSLNKIEFIETLSSPDLLNEEGYDDDQVSLFDLQHDKDVDKSDSNSDDGARDTGKTKTDASVEDFQNTDNKSDSGNPFNMDLSQESEGEDYSESDEGTDHISDASQNEEEDPVYEDSILGSFQKQHRSTDLSEYNEISDPSEDQENDIFYNVKNDVDAPDGDDDTSLYSRFDVEWKDKVDHPEDQDSEQRFADQFFYEDELEEDDDDSNEPLENARPYDESEKEQIPDASKHDVGTEQSASEDYSGTDDERPIWKSFIGDDEKIEEDDIPQYLEYADLQDEEEVDENEDAPLIDFTVQDNDVDSADQLIGWLKDDEERFTSQIFSGSEKAYEEALIDLNKLENWNQASHFIEKEIFARNLVDMYDEEAVDFTDRLQAYFDEYKS